MPEFEEVGKNVKQSFNKLKKSKIFIFAVGIVIVIALVVLFRRIQQNKQSNDDLIVASGYTGYPQTGGSGSSVTMDSGELSYLLDNVMSYVDDNLYNIQSAYDKTYDEMTSNLDSLNNQLSYQAEIINNQNATIKKQGIIAEMQANSELYNTTTDKALKTELHKRNQTLGAELGATYDNDSGNWVDDSGTALYQTNIQKLGYDTSLVSKPYNKNIDYQAIINKAEKENVSASYIQGLQRKKTEKIVGEGLNQYVTYDKNVDYQARLNALVKSGYSTDSIEYKYTAMQRNKKIEDNKLPYEKTEV